MKILRDFGNGHVNLTQYELKKALEYGNKALNDAPSPEIKKIIQAAVDTLSKGKAL